MNIFDGHGSAAFFLSALVIFPFANGSGQDSARLGKQSLIEKHREYLVPQNIVLQTTDGSATHYRINETTVLAIINASTSGRIYRSSSTATPTAYSGYLKTQTGATGYADYGWRSWVKFSLSTLSCVETVTDVDVDLYCFNAYEPGIGNSEFDTRRITADPQTSSSLSLWNAIRSGYQYDNEESADGPSSGNCSNAQLNTIDLDDLSWQTLADEHLLSAITSPGWFAVGFLVDNSEDSPDYYADFCGYNDLNPPQLVVTYTSKSNPSTPYLVSPSNGAASIPLTITLDWSSVSGAESYEVAIDDDPGFTSSIIRQVPSSNYTVQTGELSSGVSYFWKVRASNCAGNSPPTSYWSFTTVASPNITISKTLLVGFGDVRVGTNSSQQNYTVSGSNLTSNLVITAPTGFQISLSSGSGYTTSISRTPSGGTVSSTTIYVRFSPTENRSYSGSISHTSSGAVPKSVGVSGAGVQATIELSLSSLDFTNVAVGATSIPQSYTVSGTNLTGNIDINAPLAFQVSLSSDSGYTNSLSLPPSGGNVSETIIFVIFSPTENRSYSGSILHTSSAAVTETVSLNGIVSVQMVSNELPTSSHLRQNYPNPFNPSTTFRFGVAARSHVSLRIVDILGQEVERLVDEQLDPGYYETSWNANVASGLYFYRLEAVAVDDPSRQFVEVKKMILLK